MYPKFAQRSIDRAARSMDFVYIVISFHYAIPLVGVDMDRLVIFDNLIFLHHFTHFTGHLQITIVGIGIVRNTASRPVAGQSNITISRHVACVLHQTHTSIMQQYLFIKVRLR